MILPFKTYIRNPNLPWIVLVNGLFTDLSSWKGAVEEIENYNILTFNGRGQGDAPVLESAYDLDQQVEDFKNLINHLELKKFAILGLSNGGRLAMKYASLYPDDLWALVACDTYGNLTHMLKLKIESWLKAHKEGGALHRFDIATPWVWGEGIVESNPELIEHYRNLVKAQNDKNSIGLLEGALSGAIDLTCISAPTLLIVGEEDLLTPVFHHQKLKKQIAGSRLEIVPGGHASLLEHPETFKSQVIPFLEGKHELG